MREPNDFLLSLSTDEQSNDEKGHREKKFIFRKYTSNLTEIDP
jgi:hypothetical protein